MTRSKVAALLALAFIVLFCFSGVTATTTVKETAAAVEMSMPKVLFSLSSASILFIPLSLCAMIGALIALLRKQDNVGMLFAGISCVCFALFMVFFSLEKVNPSLYTPISEQLKELGVKFKKREVERIFVNFHPMTYFALACAALTAIVAKPSYKTDSARRALKRDLLPYAYIGPHLFFFVIFFITPAIYGVYAAFTKWDLFNEPVFTGLSNFRTLLFDSGNTYYKQLRNGLWNTIKFVIYCVPFCILVPLSLAVALHTRCRGNKFYQAMYYLPSLMSITTVTLTWRYVFNVDYGIVNKFLGSTANWFTPPYTWIVLVVVTVWWCTGGTMVIYQSALASIPTDQYEAAAVDGANAWQKFVNVTLPGMRYPMMYTFVMAVVAQFNIYGQPLILTGFNNQEANAVLLMYVYENAVKKQVAGMSAAMALILGVCIMAVSFVQMRVMRANAPE
ncbi:ABC transporter permease subunit [Beduinella massiliensis]|uniref:ABC transporter permease subunit n=1 Tax=Beduinella massiliensis TaxID=1852363 RepID=UPI000C864B40